MARNKGFGMSDICGRGTTCKGNGFLEIGTKEEEPKGEDRDDLRLFARRGWMP